MENFTHTELRPNYEGNASELLFSRLKNEKIKEQIVGLLLAQEHSEIGTFVNTYLEDEKGEFVFDDQGELIVKERLPYIPKTREELEKEYDKTLQEIMSITDIAISRESHELPSEEKMCIGSTSPWSNKPFTTKQMSIIEAHEKGHKIRRYFGEFLEIMNRAGI